MRTSGVVDAVGRLAGGVTALAEADLDGLPDAALLDLAREFHPLLCAAQAQFTRLVGLIHVRGAGAVDGSPTTAAWLRSQLRAGDGRGQVRAATALRSLPAVEAAYRRGEIGPAHVAVAAEVVDDIAPEVLAAGADKLLAEQASETVPSAFRRAATRIRDHFDPDAAERRARRRLTERTLSVARTFDGAVAVSGLFDPDAGELLIRSLDAFMSPPRLADPRLPGARRADALLDLCRAAAGSAPQAGGIKPQVTVTIDWQTLRGETTDLFDRTGRWTGAALPDGTPLTAAARRLACDAAIVPAVLGGRSEPLDIGRATRTIPPPIRRALVIRDGGCRFPGCDRPAGWTDAHHLRHWAAGGETALGNLVLLCRYHHTLVHEGGFGIRLDPRTGLVSGHHPDGQPLGLTSQPRANGP